MATTVASTAIRFLWAVDAREIIARRIRERRDELHLTQQEVAERGRLALRSYQRYETGTVMPRRPARRKLATALELPADELEPPVEDSPDTTSDQILESLAAIRSDIAELTRRLPPEGTVSLSRTARAKGDRKAADQPRTPRRRRAS